QIQLGRRNDATGVQVGANNILVQYQDGNDNSATHAQAGNGNIAASVQVGDDNKFSLEEEMMPLEFR
ncbi:curlin repeat-containing protein, partial [Chryseobacterium sp. CH1]|uniref:curlin repeat-containing protein n=1 Tax=Chryseobacterium sp. CH1 TaxID=713551 RepID=UPI0010283765